MKTEYTYAVARIKARETALLTGQDIDRLMACRTPEECLRVLADRGWNTAAAADAESVLAAETEKTWAFIRELTSDLSAFDVLLYPTDYNNLKAAIKCVVTGVEPHDVFLPGGAVPTEKLLAAAQSHDFSALPAPMAEAGKRAAQTLLQTRDGQLCDVILDRSCLEEILAAGKRSRNPLIEAYAEFKAATTDIKIAFRALKTGKARPFLEESLAPCGTLDNLELTNAALISEDTFFAYLSRTRYSGAVEALKAGASAFEKWCDDRQTALIRSEARGDYFTVAPLLAYVLARQNEIATVKIILSGKLNGLPDEKIRARLRAL